MNNKKIKVRSSVDEIKEKVGKMSDISKST